MIQSGPAQVGGQTHTHTQTNKMTPLCIRETDGQTQHTDGQTNSAINYYTNNITSFIFPSRPWSTPNRNKHITSIFVFYHHVNAKKWELVQPRSSPALMGGLMGRPVAVESATWCNCCHHKTHLGVDRWPRWNSLTYEFGPIANWF